MAFLGCWVDVWKYEVCERWWMSIRMGPERDLLVAEGLDPVVYARRVAEARVNRVDVYDRNSGYSE